MESRFVVNTQGERSDLLDLLIVDCLNIPALSAESHFKVFPAEAVVAAVEVTSAPKSKVQRSGIEGKVAKLEDDLLKLAKLRNIAKHREYIFTVPSQVPTGVELREIGVAYSLSPRSFLLTCGDEWTKPYTYERNLMAALNSAATKHRDIWVNGVLSMRHGFFHFKPNTPFEHTHQSDNALLEFITFLSNAIGEFPTSRINLARYRPTIPTASERPVSGYGDGANWSVEATRNAMAPHLQR